MAAALLDRLRAASAVLENTLRQAEDPTFEVRMVDLTLVHRLRTVVGEVARAAAEATAEERVQASPDYRTYLENLTRLGAVVDGWQTRLLTHRARLDRDGGHLDAARRWAEAYSRTR